MTSQNRTWFAIACSILILLLLCTFVTRSIVVADQDHPTPSDLEALPYVSPQPHQQVAGDNLRVDSLWSPERSVSLLGRKYNIVVFVDNDSGTISEAEKQEILTSMDTGARYWQRHAALFNAYYELDYETHSVSVPVAILDYPCGVNDAFMPQLLNELGVTSDSEDIWWRMDEHIRQKVTMINTSLAPGEYPVTDATFVFVFGNAQDSDKRFAKSSRNTSPIACAYLGGPSMHITASAGKHALIHAHEDVHAKAAGPDRYSAANAPCNLRPVYLDGPNSSYFNQGSLFRMGDPEVDQYCLEENPWLNTDIMAKPWRSFNRLMNLPEDQWNKDMFTPEYEWFNGYADEELPDGIPDSLGTITVHLETDIITGTVAFTLTRNRYIPRNPIASPNEDIGYFLPEGIVLRVAGFTESFPIPAEHMSFEADELGRPYQKVTGTIYIQQFLLENPELAPYQLELGAQLYGMLHPVSVSVLTAGEVYAPPVYQVYLPLVGK